MAVATANLNLLRQELGAQAQALLDCTPYQDIITAPQDYDSRAISFRLLFGYIPERQTNKQQEVWVLLYPPSKHGGHAEVQFHSGGAKTGTFAKHDDSNIGSTVTAFTIAFKTPKKASKSKYVAMAKYYFLESLAAMETRMGSSSELEIPIPITRTFVDGLRSACREFEEAKTKASHVVLRQPPATSVDEEVSDPNEVPDDVFGPAQTVQPCSIIPPGISATPTHSDAYVQLAEALAKLHDEEDHIQSSDSDLETQLAALEVARQEIEGEQRLLEERRLMNKEKKATIAVRREQLLKGISVMEAFRLGAEIERSYPGKRRKLA